MRIVLTSIAALICTTVAAHAQLQPGPNLTPSGRPFLYAPRAGYLGPPVAVHSAARAPFPLVYWRTGAVSIPARPMTPPPPPPPSVDPPGPSAFAQGGPPVAAPPPPAAPPRNNPTSALPRGQRSPVPCPNGCEVDMPGAFHDHAD